MTVDWRTALKPAEIPVVEGLDRDIDFYRNKATEMTAERDIIRRRAVARIRLAGLKAGVK